MVVLDDWYKWCILIQPSPCFQKYGSILTQHDAEYLVNSLNFHVEIFILPVTECPISRHGNSINYNLITFNMLFDAG